MATIPREQSRVEPSRSPCPLASILDLVGDKWSLLIIRDMMFMKKRLFNEFLESGERISTNILASRLKLLEAKGLVVKEPYQSRPVRYAYSLTDAALDLFPILVEMAKWANKHIPGTMHPPQQAVDAFLAEHGDKFGELSLQFNAPG